MNVTSPYGTRPWDPGSYTCAGKTGYVTSEERTHAKGCKKTRPLRWDPKISRVFTLECARHLPEELKTRLVRCVPTRGRAIHD